jgi:hypothetical protein
MQLRAICYPPLNSWESEQHGFPSIIDSFQTICTWREGEFSGVENFVFDDVPDNSLPREFAEELLLFFAQGYWRWECVRKVGGRPVRECVLNHLRGVSEGDNSEDTKLL